jgi:hypothetical protein
VTARSNLANSRLPVAICSQLRDGPPALFHADAAGNGPL